MDTKEDDGAQVAALSSHVGNQKVFKLNHTDMIIISEVDMKTYCDSVTF